MSSSITQGCCVSSKERSATILLYDREYRNISHNTIAGMFLAADFLGATPTLMIRQDEKIVAPGTPPQNPSWQEGTTADFSLLHLAQRVIPTGEFRAIECGLTCIDVFRHSLSPQKDFNAVFPNLSSLLYSTTIVGTRLNSVGEAMSTLIVTFSDAAILQGFMAFLSAHGVYPTEVFIFENTQYRTRLRLSSKKFDSETSPKRDSSLKRWTRIDINFGVSVNGDPSVYVTGPVVHVTFNSFVKIPQRILSFTSSDPKGWKRRELFGQLNQVAKDMKPDDSLWKDSTLSISALDPLGDGRYSAVIAIQPLHNRS